MNNQIFVGFLLVLAFKGITSQYPTFVKIVKEEVDLDCITAKGYSLNEATTISGTCVYSGLISLPNADAQIKRLCTDDLAKECIDKFKEVILSCLPEETHKTVNQMTAMDYNAALTLCTDNGKNYRTIAQNPCSFYTDMMNTMSKCDEKLEKKMTSLNLKDFFAGENCPKFEEYYECSKEKALMCPQYGTTYPDLYDGFAEVSPCNIKNESPM